MLWNVYIEQLTHILLQSEARFICNTKLTTIVCLRHGTTNVGVMCLHIAYTYNETLQPYRLMAPPWPSPWNCSQKLGSECFQTTRSWGVLSLSNKQLKIIKLYKNNDCKENKKNSRLFAIVTFFVIIPKWQMNVLCTCWYSHRKKKKFLERRSNLRITFFLSFVVYDFHHQSLNTCFLVILFNCDS